MTIDLNTFTQDLVIAVISSVLTVAIAFITYKLNVRARENNALRSLFEDLSTRRALVTIEPIEVLGAHDIPDYQRVNSSILLVKEEIKRARDTIRPIPVLENSLRSMIKSCNIYLEEAEESPDHYQFYLMKLSHDLEVCMHDIHNSRRTVSILKPGENAFYYR